MERFWILQQALSPIDLSHVGACYRASGRFCDCFPVLCPVSPPPDQLLLLRLALLPLPAASPHPSRLLTFPLQLTETSSRYARKISGTTALQEALKEKQQHIEQLLAERDLERAEVAKATSHVGEMEQELALARDGHDQVTSGQMVMTGAWKWHVRPAASWEHWDMSG